MEQVSADGGGAEAALLLELEGAIPSGPNQATLEQRSRGPFLSFLL